MGTIVVATVPTPGRPDAPAEGFAAELARLGHDQFTQVRVGRRYLLSIDGPVTPAALAAARAAAEGIIDTEVEQIARVSSRDDDDASAPWEHFGTTWGGDDALTGGMRAVLAAHEPAASASPHDIRERDLSEVQSGSIAAYTGEDD